MLVSFLLSAKQGEPDVIIEHENANTIRIAGIICPITWDKEGNVIDIMIAAEG